MERYRPEMDWNPIANDPPPESAFNRMVSDDPTLQRQAEEAMKEKFRHSELEKGAIELPLSSHEREVAKGVLKVVEDFVRQYGGNPVALDDSQVRLIVREAATSGRFFTTDQRIDVHFKENSPLYLPLFAHIIAHEALHADAYISGNANKRNEDGSYDDRHYGLALVEKNKVMGVWLNEAVTEELTKRCRQLYLRDVPELHYQNDLLDLVKEGTENTDEVAGVTGVKEGEDGERIFSVTFNAYPEERKKLNGLLDDMSAKLPERFPTREDAFNMFARAHFTGNLLPLGRELEGLYGKNALRRLLEGEQLW